MHDGRDARRAGKLTGLTLLVAACNFPDSSPLKIGTQALWIASADTVVEYLPSELASGTDKTPHRKLASAALGSPQGVVFDADGNLWVVDPAADVEGASAPAVLEFSASQLASLATEPTPTPPVTILSAAFDYPQQATFDSQGNLWVSDRDRNELLMFSSTQLLEVGVHTLAPAVIVTSTALDGPSGIAFDSSRNLWVANLGAGAQSSTGAAQGTTIVEFKSTDVPTLGTGNTLALTAAVTVSDDGSESVQAPWALAFDADGNLWAGNSISPSTLVEFATDSLSSGGKPTPLAIVSPTTESGASTLEAPHGICFDDAGNLAAMNAALEPSVALFAASQLKTGSPQPGRLSREARPPWAHLPAALSGPSSTELATEVSLPHGRRQG